jgi:hypothetical protein
LVRSFWRKQKIYFLCQYSNLWSPSSWPAHYTDYATRRASITWYENWFNEIGLGAVWSIGLTQGRYTAGG